MFVNYLMNYQIYFMREFVLPASPSIQLLLLCLSCSPKLELEGARRK